MAAKRKTGFFERLKMAYNFSDERESLYLIYISYFLLIIFGIVICLLHLVEGDLLPVSYRYHAILVLALINLWLLKKRFVNLARILTLTLLPFAILILPPLTGLVEDEYFFWFPYVPTGLSLIPHFILHTRKNRLPLFLILFIYLLLALFIDKLLIHAAPENIKIIPLIEANYFYYKLIPIFIFLFVNAALGLLFAQNNRYEEIMKDQRDELVRAEKMVSMATLSAGIAHEINNPLNFISGSLQALTKLRGDWHNAPPAGEKERDARLDQVAEVIDKASEGVERAEEIITKLAFFSSPEHAPLKDSNIKELVYNSLRILESRMPYYIKLSIDIPDNLSLQCREAQVRTVCSHIVRNAIDALESKDQKGRESIKISAAEKVIEGSSFIAISFCNSGPAIPEGDLNHIFDPFFTSREAGKGTGLGMSLSYMIVHEHRGRIEVSNKNGQVNFDLILPVRQKSE